MEEGFSVNRITVEISILASLLSIVDLEKETCSTELKDDKSSLQWAVVALSDFFPYSEESNMGVVYDLHKKYIKGHENESGRETFDNVNMLDKGQASKMLRLCADHARRISIMIKDSKFNNIAGDMYYDIFNKIRDVCIIMGETLK